MKTTVFAIVALGFVAAIDPAAAQAPAGPQRDGLYRGTIACGLPVLRSRQRAAIEMTIAGREVTYKRPVIENNVTLGEETGKGTLDGDKLTLTGQWRGDKAGVEAAYTGGFVRRASLKFSGTQTWTRDGKTTRQNCSGSAKRAVPAIFRRKVG